MGTGKSKRIGVFRDPEDLEYPLYQGRPRKGTYILAKGVRDRMALPAKTIHKVVQVVVEEMTRGLKTDGWLELPGIGVLVRKTRVGRVRDPELGRSVPRIFTSFSVVPIDKWKPPESL